MKVVIADSDEKIHACFPAMFELRPHLTEKSFCEQVKRQIQNHDYTLVFVQDDDRIVSVAGYRVCEYLAWSKILYVDDLVTAQCERKRGYGGYLLDWLIKRSTLLACDEFHLDSGPHRHDAHRLYMSRKMNINSYHFSLTCKKLVI